MESVEQQQLGCIKAAWKDIVGADLAKRSRPIGLNRGALIIEAASTPIMQVLAFLTQRICEKLPQSEAWTRVERLRLRCVPKARHD